MRLCIVLTIFILYSDRAYSTLTPDEEIQREKGIKETEDDKDLITVMLSEIKHYTRKGNIIDISLDRKTYNEVCYVRPPNDQQLEVPLLQMEGVKVEFRSDFVSCRMAIGPMNDDLLGKWELCGRSESGGMRCQPVIISWYNYDGSGNWDHINEKRYTHPVHIGGSVSTGVSGYDTATTCHVVTPAGEDLVLTNDVKYPHIERSTIDNPNLCSVLIKDITPGLLGNWIIYARFYSILGQSEVRLPLTFTLYNEDNPYDQAFNVTVLEVQKHLVNLGTDLSINVTQKTGSVEDCIYTSPSGQSYNINNNTNLPDGVTLIHSETRVLCQITFNPITEQAVGEWQIIGKFRNGVLFDERRLTFEIIKEDPDNPIEENIERLIETMEEQTIITQMNNTHIITINSDVFIQHEGCRLVTPDGLQYGLIPGFNVSGVQIIHPNGVDCAIALKLESENMIGEWTLIARAIRYSIPIERRLHFTVRVEERFVIQNDIYIQEGANLYLHLNSAISMPETCVLYGPDGNMTWAEYDPGFRSSCGYIVRAVNHRHNGTWVIEYGHKIKYIGSVNVHLIDSKDLSLDDMQWSVGDSINMTIGPKNAVYCVIRNNFGIIYDNFGQCKLILDRVTIDHRGYWTVSIGLSGSVLLQQYGFYVNIDDGGFLVKTTVRYHGPTVLLTCSVPFTYEVNACKFRDRQDNILIAAHGVGHDEYRFNFSIANVESAADSHDCTLCITNPSPLHLGIWRCALDTSAGTYYGFLTVEIPDLMQDPSVAGVIDTEPVLKAKTSSNLEGEPVTLSCSISSALRYCYFRAGNGTVYNVFPRMPPENNFGYVGAGLDAGECGIRFNRLSFGESKGWSCHVGLANTTANELRANVYIDFKAKMLVAHYWNYSRMLVVEARVYNEHALDYCRFVRVDGRGFTSDNLLNGYELHGSLHMGYCILHIKNPCPYDLHPWTIAVKLTGADGEISMTTTDNLFTSLGTPNTVADILFWMFLFSMIVIPIMAAFVFIPKKNRDWTYSRASRMRDSFRSSWSKTFGRRQLARPQGS